MYESIPEHHPPNRSEVVVRTVPTKVRFGEIASEQYIYALYKVSEQRSRATRIIGSNDAPPDWQIGSVIRLSSASNASYADLGKYKIVGVMDTVERQVVGHFPSQATAYATFV